MIYNRYKRKRPKVDAKVGRVGKKEKKILTSMFERSRLWTSFESSPVSVNE